MALVSSISLAPVKALGLVHPDTVLLEPFGVRENRRFYLADEAGRMLNGKRFGALVEVSPSYDDAAGTLELAFPDGTVAAGEIALGEPLTTDFYGRPVDSNLVVGPWSEALTAFAGAPVRLARTAEPGAAVDRGYAGAVSIVSNASLEALRRVAGAEEPVDGRRFRMLLAVDGVGAHEEDGWLGRRVRVGGAVLVPRGLVGRCAVTTQNPDTGVPDLDTLRALKAYREDVPTDEPLPFGVYGEVAEPGTVAVGDAVTLDV